MKKMILCADDYGQNTAISTGIRKLVTKQRLTAVSCMVNMPDWKSDAAKLQEHRSQIDIGLHFNLTEGTALYTGQPHPSHKKLMWQAFSGQLSQEAIEAELEAQLRQFKAAMQTNPMFIDGHQHIQHLPVIRDALIAVINNHFPEAPPYVRLCAAPSFAISRKRADMHKQWIIHFTGVNQFKKILDASGIPHNAAFAGIYNFKPTPPYRAVFQQFLASLQNNSIVMCHPGDASDADDALKISRPLELGYIESEKFTQDLLTHNIKLCRFQELT